MPNSLTSLPSQCAVLVPESQQHSAARLLRLFAQIGLKVVRMVETLLRT